MRSRLAHLHKKCCSVRQNRASGSAAILSDQQPINFDVKVFAPLADVLAGGALGFHADFSKNTARCRIGRKMAGMNTVQLKMVESVLQDLSHGLRCNIPCPRMARRSNSQVRRVCARNSRLVQCRRTGARCRVGISRIWLLRPSRDVFVISERQSRLPACTDEECAAWSRLLLELRSAEAIGECPLAEEDAAADARFSGLPSC